MHLAATADRTPQLDLARAELTSNKQNILPPAAGTELPEAIQARRSSVATEMQRLAIRTFRYV